ncbi:uncharacterized protein LOC6726978 isoform X1 [Drosophila simulans]|uniref:GD19880 n=2 Tax=Drosophila simulans TaxID=7240 RepID=B4QYC5_DROSI|nr:uncharacterized protein LOC6726978 isoform X1 [Drosophila simulans]EDX11882.1 GD19880 [Drosophila simulans]KMZ01874.1 uncharacterized protein Dsimw501_GD19880 [Drosophila simulans]
MMYNNRPTAISLEEEVQYIYKYPLLPTPLIDYGFIYNLVCNKPRDVSLPLILEIEPEFKPKDSAEKPKKVPRLSYHSRSSSMSEDEPEPEVQVKYKWNSPRLMILCEDGDINCAMHYLVESLHDPFACNAVATLFLQESILEEFVDRIRDCLEPLSTDISGHPAYIKTLERLNHLKAKTIVGNPKTVPENASPMLVYDLNHRYLADGPTGVITLHTFRTMKEAVELQAKEPLNFTSVCIWNEKLAAAYELVARLNPLIFTINCYYVNLNEITLPFVCNFNSAKIVDGYHYESLTFQGKRKVVVHPVGTIWAKLAREALVQY